MVQRRSKRKVDAHWRVQRPRGRGSSKEQGEHKEKMAWGVESWVSREAWATGASTGIGSDGGKEGGNFE